MQNFVCLISLRSCSATWNRWRRSVLAVLVLSGGITAGPARAQWEELSEVVASDGEISNYFGQSVAMLGTTAVIGAPQANHNGNDSGAAYVFTLSGGTWTEQQVLLPSDGDVFANFGFSVAIDGNVIVVGAYGDATNGSYAGAAYVFRKSGGTWIEEDKLLASDGALYDFFGEAVSVSGDVAAIGARGEDAGSSNAGAAYIYRYNGTSWDQEQKITASTSGSNAEFGSSVAASGNRVFVGARGHAQTGAVMIFTDNGSSWNLTQTLTASDADLSDRFGARLAINDDLLVVGAPRNDDLGLNSGSAYIFRLSGSSWAEEQKLLPADGTAGDLFGGAVAAAPGIAVIGAHSDAPDPDGFQSQAGSAYVFCLNSPDAWGEDGKLTAGYPFMWDHFGASVGIAGNMIVAGAYGDDNVWGDAGAATFFSGQCAGGQTGCGNDSECDDGDPCTIDDCAGGQCVNTPLDCDDGNPCTADLCSGGGCAHPPVADGTACGSSASSPCDGPDTCQDGVCDANLAAFGTACTPDSNPCTSDICNGSGTCTHPNAPAGTACDDGDSCTEGDTCNAGTCSGSDMDCDDGNPCTLDLCSGGGCAHPPVSNGTPCGSSASSQCDGADSCRDGACDPNHAVFGTACAADNNQCTNDICDGSGSCTHPNAPSGTTCDDGNDCTDDDVCNGGSCSGSGMDCNDGDACTFDNCDVAGGCTHEPLNCDDKNDCTEDDCDPADGCVNVPVDCDDGNACTSDGCEPTFGCWNTPLDCDDNDACTTDGCDPNSGCTHDALDCDDGDACTQDDCTAEGGCLHTALNCDDHDACTADGCDPDSGCTHDAMDCDDQDACTADDCTAEGGCLHEPMDCDDNDACTTDSCDMDSGCQNVAIDCDDNDACTADSCHASLGCRNLSIDCDDNDPCTNDGCDSAGGCFNDALECPAGSSCVDGDCVSQACDDNGICQDDEDCDNCPADCFSYSGPSCGNGLCEAGDGEDCLSCPADCNGKQNGNPSNRFCCGDGGGQNPVDCGDERCTVGEFECSDESLDDSCCGDGICQGLEDGFNCETDCGPPPCGDGLCDGDEDECNCPEDCGEPPADEIDCGDGVDDDCDGDSDCDDSDCYNTVDCPCLPGEAPCESHDQCCSGKCRGNGRCRG